MTEPGSGVNIHATKQLIRKDWHIMRAPVLFYWGGGVLAVILAIIGNETIGTHAFILFVTAIAAAGVHCVIQTIVVERKNRTCHLS